MVTWDDDCFTADGYGDGQCDPKFNCEDLTWHEMRRIGAWLDQGQSL